MTPHYPASSANGSFTPGKSSVAAIPIRLRTTRIAIEGDRSLCSELERRWSMRLAYMLGWLPSSFRPRMNSNPTSKSETEQISPIG